MSIKVKIHPMLRQSTNGQTEAQVEGNSIGECLKYLICLFPDLEERIYDMDGELFRFVEIILNSNNANEDLTTRVKEGDEISLVILITGG